MKSKIRSIIVDDNPLNIEVLSDLLLEHGDQIQLVGAAANGREAMQLITEHQPDLVFLDVEMPDMNGFEVLASLEEINFQTIFVTAHDHYAIQAIRYNALDYLMKPLDRTELKDAINRYDVTANHPHRDQIQNALDNLKTIEPLDQVLYLPSQEGGVKMLLRDVVRIAGDRNYSTFYLASHKTKISSKNLGHFEDMLAGKDFCRCHRSFIVNRRYIEKLHAGFFLMIDGMEIPISRRRKTEVKEWFMG